MICLMHLTSLLCMEKQCKENLFVSYAKDTNEFPLTKLKTTPVYQKIPLTANEPGWEKLNEIADIKNTHLSALSEPITQYTNSWIKKTNKEEQKPNSPIIQKLYEQAFSLAQDSWINGYRNIKNKDLLILLRNMHEAEQYSINEDIMGAFTYKQSCGKENYFAARRCATLLFGYFKKYRLNATKAKELLQPHNYFDRVDKKEEKKIAVNLCKQLDITLTEISYQENTAKKINVDFPHFWQLEVDLEKLFLSDEDKLQTLICCIYNQKKLSKNCPHGTYTDLKAEFCKETASLLELFHYVKEQEQRTYNIIQMIENAKKAKEILHEKDLALSILKSDKLTFYDYFHTPESVTDKKNKAIILCNLIDHYNKTKNEKMTPIPDQFVAYNLNKNLDIALPDSFNHTLFDKDSYAFEEFKQLCIAIRELVDLKSKHIQECVTYLYGKHA
jgi:hypothetical protein